MKCTFLFRQLIVLVGNMSSLLCIINTRCHIGKIIHQNNIKALITGRYSIFTATVVHAKTVSSLHGLNLDVRGNPIILSL